MFMRVFSVIAYDGDDTGDIFKGIFTALAVDKTCTLSQGMVKT